MRLQIVKSKNAESFYVIKSLYVSKKNTTRVVEKLGTRAELEKKLNGADPILWAKKYIAELNRLEKEKKLDIVIKYSQNQIIEKDEKRLFNCGYLFLQKIYNELKLPIICKEIGKKYKYDFDMNSILSRLVYGRIIFPRSKHATCELSKKFIEQPNFELHQIYKALEIIAKETDFIQSKLYKNKVDLTGKKSQILYYDCTNYFFEIEEEEGLKQYGYSKDHKPNPIVQMGLFMDGDGMPLAFNINAGNTNEQITLRPLERQILRDFELGRFVVCTDAGLSSIDNRKFNNVQGRKFITTQSVKKLKKHDEKWALDNKNWRIFGDNNSYDISNIDEDKHINTTFYKETWINDDEIEQRLIVTYSVKYKNYQRNIRNSQIDRAMEAIIKSKGKLSKATQNDYKRFIVKMNCTQNGEVAENEIFNINEEKIKQEEKFDGFYGVCTNLEDEISSIIEVNSRRWEIEESFRIMKSEFKSRPVYLKRDDRIKAHFTTCFISLMLFRLLEKRLDSKYTAHEIISTLREMNLLATKNGDYIPAYTRTDLTDDLHDIFEFRTDFQIIPRAHMKNILSATKK